jgi:hypothetical protein
MPGSSTTPGRSDLAMVRPKRVAFRARNSVGTRGLAFAAQWLAYALPYRRFVGVLTDANARLGADVDRYSFIVVDLHHLLLAGLPAHFESYMPSQAVWSSRAKPARGSRCELEMQLAMSESRSNSVIPSAVRPLFPRKRKSIRDLAMSQNCQHRSLAALLDHLGRRSRATWAGR